MIVEQRFLNGKTATEGPSLEPPEFSPDPGREGRSNGAASVEVWRDLNRRFRLLWILLLASLPGTFVLAWLLSGVFPPRATLAVIGALWMTAVARAGWNIARFSCPRCGLAFFENWIFLKMLRDRCAHCGLPRYSARIAPR